MLTIAIEGCILSEIRRNCVRMLLKLILPEEYASLFCSMQTQRLHKSEFITCYIYMLSQLLNLVSECKGKH